MSRSSRVRASVGVDVGGTKIAAAVVDAGGKIMLRDRCATPQGNADVVLARVAAIVNDLVLQVQQTDIDIECVGVGVCGLVDASQSMVYVAPNVGWTEVSVRAHLQDAVKVPVIVENDGAAAAWGEVIHGAGLGLRAIIMVTVGTGIGGGIVFEGRVLRGGHGVAAEIGHLNAVPDGRPCGCGSFGCWEQYGSGSALLLEAREGAERRPGEATLLLSLGDGTPAGIVGSHVTDAARRGDVVALQAFATVGTWLGRGLADLIAVLDPDAFIIGGGVSDAADLLLPSVEASMKSRVFAPRFRPLPDIRIARLGNDAGLIGAADLAFRSLEQS